MAPGGFFSHPTFTDIYSFILHLVDDLYDSVKATGPQHRDQLVAGAIAEVQRAFAAGEALGLRSPATRCAYFYSFVPSHINAVRYFMNLSVKRGKVAELVQAVEDEHRLQMVALGGGPGGALLGMLHWLADVGCWNCAVEEFVIDPMGTDWVSHQEAIGKQVAKAGLNFRQHCLRCSYNSQINMQRVVDKVAHADLVTMVKGVTSTGCGSGVARDNVWGLLRHMKDGAVLLVIDDTAVVETFVAERAEAALFQAVARMEFNDANKVDFVLPGDEERLAICFQAAATKFGGWPVQEAYITGIVFKRVLRSSGDDAVLGNGMNPGINTGPLLQRPILKPAVHGRPGSRKPPGKSDIKRAGNSAAAGRGMHTSGSAGHQAIGRSGHRGSTPCSTSTMRSHTFNSKKKSVSMKPSNAIVKVENTGIKPGVHGASRRPVPGNGTSGVSNGEVKSDVGQCSSFLLSGKLPMDEMQLRQQQQEWRWATTSQTGSQRVEGGQQGATQVLDLNTHRVVDPNASNTSSHQLTRVVDLNYQRVVDGQAQARAQNANTTVVDLNQHRVVAVNQEGCQNSRVVDLSHQRVVSSDSMHQSSNQNTAVVDLNNQRLVGLGGSMQAPVGSTLGQSLGGIPAVHRPMMVVPTQARTYGAQGSSNGQLFGKRSRPDNSQVRQLGAKHIRYS